MAMAHPLISVVVPAYNAGRWIDRTLASIQGQTWREIEIIVVDDGSSDDTVVRVERAAAADRRIRLVRQTNAGPAVARNRGLRECRGVFVAPVDADDLWAPDNLAQQAAALMARPDAAFAFARSLWIDADDRILAPPSDDKPPVCTYQALLEDNFIGNGSACVFRRAALEAIGGYDERYCGGGEDWLLTLKLAAMAAFVCVPSYLIGYRQSAATFSATRSAEMCDAHVRIVAEMQRSGPKLAAISFARARTRGLIWYLPRLRRSGNWRALLHYASIAFLANPFWFEDARARRFVAGAVRRRLGAPAATPASYAGPAFQVCRPLAAAAPATEGVA
ncbi:MAG: glycosyltransferase family A protein [Caulobacterales bacterium]